MSSPPWVAWRSKSEGSGRLLSDKNTVFLEALSGLGCLPQCCLSVAGGGLVEAKDRELQLRVGGSGFPAAEGLREEAECGRTGHITSLS